MKLVVWHYCLLISILMALNGCKGQSSHLNNAVKKSKSLGVKVTALEKQTWCVYQDKSGNYWFGSYGNGVIKYNGASLTKFTTKDGLVDNAIRGMQEDVLGNVYIETPEGVSKYDGNSFSTLKIIDGTDDMWQLEPDDLWFNCNGHPKDVYRYDGEKLIELSLPRKDLNKAFGGTEQGLSYSEMNNSPYAVYGLNKDSGGNLWLGTVSAGAYRYDGQSFLWFPEKELSTLPDGRVPGVRSILEDKDGFFWLSNFLSRYSVNKDSLSYKKMKGVVTSNAKFKDSIKYFLSGVIDNEGNLWMATYEDGIWQYDGEMLNHFPVSHNGQDVLVISIYYDRSGQLWLGTDNAQVFKYNGADFVKFTP